MIVTPKMITELKGNNKLKAQLSIAHKCTVYTIDRWIRKKDIKHLTTLITLHFELIQHETGFDTGDILMQ
jgi:hypothetical protein